MSCSTAWKEDVQGRVGGGEPPQEGNSETIVSWPGLKESPEGWTAGRPGVFLSLYSPFYP